MLQMESFLGGEGGEHCWLMCWPSDEFINLSTQAELHMVTEHI